MNTEALSPSHDPAEILAIIGQHSKARCAARAVLTVLASFVRWSGEDAGTCYPSMRLIAELAGVTVRTVQRSIPKLVGLDEVEVVQQGTGRKSTVYRLKILERAKLSWQGRQKRPPNLLKSTSTPKPPKSRRSRSLRDSWRSRRHATDTPRETAQAAQSRSAPPQSPVAGARQAMRGIGPVAAGGAPRASVAHPAPSPASSRALTAAQIEEARRLCDPVGWDRLRLAAGLDGVASGDLDAAAARRWRADAIMRGVQLVA